MSKTYLSLDITCDHCVRPATKQLIPSQSATDTVIYVCDEHIENYEVVDKVEPEYGKHSGEF